MAMARRLITSSGYGPGRTQARAGAMALTLLVYALLIALMLIFRNAPPRNLQTEARLTTILPTPPKPKPPVKPKLNPSPRLAKFLGVQSERPPAPAPPLLPDEPAPAIIAPIIELPSLALAEAGPSSAPGQSAQAGAGDGQLGGGMSFTAGSGGMPLSKAEWFRDPTYDELRRYLPANAPGKGWGLIACRTMSKYRVTDCEILGESPRGSGYAKAARDAAHQYMVKPPRINGKAQIGAWVSIRINY